MSFVIFLSLLCAVVSSSYVEVLTTNNFTLTYEGAWMVKFYAPWCPHCQALAPAWASFAETAQSTKQPFHVAEVDCTINPDICGDIKGYPTLLFIQRSAGVEGERIPSFENTPDSWLSWAIENVDPILARSRPLTADTANALPVIVEATKALRNIASRAEGLKDRVEALKRRTEAHRVFRTEGLHAPKGAVVLSGEEYAKKTQEGDWIVFFGAEWCMGCAGEATQAIEELAAKDKPFQVGYVDCGKDIEICNKEKVTESLPKVIAFVNSQGVKDSSLPGVSREGLAEYIRLLSL